ncbi:hypothetical protein LPB87_19885 [Flavobacterium sp. EDS]|uniref:hypothetical protein n=1 Tax=Flavobacterium sp. EDS TaxID=2897328 RepID=UPI001E5AD410|nr:hypothetical protein [Flavobacterium sp. EDS]MCD0476658.1 hypothetical protein [Flavobacterium sp. EDS]
MKYTILLCLALCFFCCGPMGNCNEEAEDLKGDECLLIVREIPTDTDDRFDYKGINPVTEKECDCNSSRSDRWWADYKKDIAIGDTIIKKKGELIFSIHKKDTVLSFNFECDGKVYK